MDKNDDPLQTYSRISPLEIDEEEDDEGIGPLEKLAPQEEDNPFLKTIFPDADRISICGHLLVEGGGVED